MLGSIFNMINVVASRIRGPRCCYMDGHVILNTQGVLDSAVAPAKGIRTGCPDAPSDGFVSHGEREIYKSVGLLLGIKRLPGDPFLLRAKAYIYSFRGTVPLINGEEIFYVVMMTIGVSRSIITLRTLSETMVGDGCGPWLLVVIAYYPDVYALPASFALPWIGEAETSFWFGFVVRNGSKKDCFICRVSEAGEKAIDKLDVKEFRERFCIPNDVSIDLVNEEAAMPTEKGEENVILFTKEQFNAGLRFPLPALFKEFLHFSQIPPIFIHPNLVRVLMGCSIINMLYSLDLTLLEVFFVYSLKKAKNDIFSVSAHLPSLQMVTELPDSTKGGAKGLVAVRGGWAGLSQRASRPFSPNYTLKIPGLELRGHLVDWVEKASFACVCKLFEIDPKERAYKTLLSARNLIAVVRESQEYVINILPRKLAKDEIVPGEHYTVKELPLYQEAKEADAERRRKLLEDRDQKKTEGTIRKAPGQKRGPDSPPKKTSGKRRKLVKKHGKDRPRTHVGVESFGPSLAAVARLANVAEEAASINRPGNLNPDADAAETAPLEEAGAESQSQPSDDPDRLAIVLVKGPPQRSRVRRAIYGPDSWAASRAAARD
ncbi:hypothetical protein CK203_013125 [Vitis vinifera]|uniref:Uncharacterized protein n=1 Tax=Vitis vinifera TaxID=29760 RepID=A0A438JM64_VITVI|nr:hypothetical protein CK203_013125 [Vitis vinifera]